MKVTINVECTPEEARIFLGLPDVAPLQEEMMGRMREQMDSAAQAMSPEQMMKALFPLGAGAGTDGFADMQKAFWTAMTTGMNSGMGGAAKPPSGSSKKKK